MVSALKGRHIVVAISGGVAAYKCVELVRRLRQAGASVRVVMTRGACQFITPLTLQAVSGERVCTELLDPEAEAAMGHIELARWADALLIAPASANVIARLAHGLADDLLTTLCLATQAPIFIAPAMNHHMWTHAATMANCACLQERGTVILGPDEGELACGDRGLGRMLEPECLFESLENQWRDERLAGRKVVVTAGPTREYIDPVRYLTNRSSGKMGFAVAAAAAAAGAEVALISGPTALSAPPGLTRIDVESAEQMFEAVKSRLDNCDIFISVAAVADYRPTCVAERKIKKNDVTMNLVLQRTPDILAHVAASSPDIFTVGFAAETNDVAHYALDKLMRKGLDMIAANHVGQPDTGFDADDNALTVFWQGGQAEILQAKKQVVADELIALVADRVNGQEHEEKD